MSVRIQTGPIDMNEVVDSVRREEAGAVVTFLGTVRADPNVKALEYEVYEEMALRKLRELEENAKRKFGILEMAIVHRTGRLFLGEDAVMIACSTPHRHEAFKACEWAMEELKRIVPIWKEVRWTNQDL